MNTGSSQTTGRMLTFQGVPNAGFAVDTWTINGKDYTAADTLPAWITRSADNQKLTIASFDAVNHTVANALTVKVTFRNANNLITYSVNGDLGGKLSATVSKGGSEEANLDSNTAVALGSQVTITAAPAANYVVDHWVVNGVTYKRDSSETVYRGETLVLSDVQTAYNVQVFFLNNSGTTFTATTVVANEEGVTDNSLAGITAKNADNGNDVDLTALKDGDSIRFTANLNSPINNIVKEWQTSTDGVNYETIKNSGGQTTITLFNMTQSIYVRAIITIAQTHNLAWSIEMRDGGDVPTAANAVLTAVSNSQTLTAGAQNAYIPVSFALALDNAYYVVGWSENVTANAEDNTKASMSSLTNNENVVVTIAAKPVMSIAAVTGGTITATGTVNGVADTAVADGDYIDNDTAIAVTLTPDHGYVVDAADTTDGLAYEDGDGTTSDVKTYTVENVTEDKTISHNFTALGKVDVAYGVVDVNSNGSGYNGKITAEASRKDVAAYVLTDAEGLTANGTKAVYEEGQIEFTTAANSGYVVKQWVVGGEVYKANNLTYTSNTLTLTYDQLKTLANATVTVQFEPGDPYITYSNPANGTLSAVAAGNDFSSGGQSKAPVTFTAVPAENYEVKEWTVNGTKVDDETNNTFVYTPAGINADIAVLLWGKVLNVTANADNGGSVAAVGEVRYNGQVTLTATADSGYGFDGWYLNNNRVSDNAEYTFTALEDGAYTAKFKASENNPISFAVNDALMGGISARVNGSAVNTGDSVVGGRTVAFSVVVNEGYRITGWTGLPKDAVISADKKTATAIVPNGGLTVEVQLEPIPTHTITIVQPDHGTITAKVGNEDVTSVVDGTVVTFAVTAEPNWMLGSWTNSASSESGITFTMTVNSDLTIGAVMQEAVRYTVHYSAEDSSDTVSASADGTPITAATDVQIVGGSKLRFTAAPVSGKMVKAWTVTVKDANVDVSDNLSNTLTVDYLSGNTVVTVSYEDLVEYAIPVGTGDYTIGSVEKTPEWTTDGKIRKGGDVKFTVTPASGKVITALTPSAGSAKRNIDGSWTVTVEDVQADITLNATVTSGIVLNIATADNGTLSVKRGGIELADGAAVEVGDVLVISGTGTGNYRLEGLMVNSQLIASGSSYTVAATDVAVNVTGTFAFSGGGGGGGGGAVSDFTLSFNTNGGSSIASVSVAADKTVSLSAYVPTRTGYTFSGWCSDEALTKSVTEIKVAKNTTVYAKWTQSGSSFMFEDVFEDDYYYDAVYWAKDKGITNGITATKFGPDGICTRAQAVTFLWRAMGSPEPASTSCDFTDVKTDAYYYNAVLWATEKGITLGTSNTTFSPNATVTRAQTMAFIWRTADKPDAAGENIFGDVNESAYYSEAVLWAVEEGITNGTSNTAFSPNAYCTRAQIVTFLYRYLGK